MHACNSFLGKRKCDSGSIADSLENREITATVTVKWDIAINKLKISLSNVNIILPKQLTGDNRLGHLHTSVQNGTAFCRLKYKVCVSCSVMSNFCNPVDSAQRLLCPWDSPGKNTGVGSHFLLRRIFPTQGLNPGLLHCRCILSHLNYQGSPVSKEEDPLINCKMLANCFRTILIYKTMYNLPAVS